MEDGTLLLSNKLPSHLALYSCFLTLFGITGTTVVSERQTEGGKRVARA